MHFLALGAALFVLFSFVNSRSAPHSQKVFVTSGKIDQMITVFSRTWQRPPTAEELDGLIEDEISEEVLYREAMAMGLDKDDTIVRRRLRQKFEFLMEDVEAVSVPSDRDLQDWLDKNPGKFSTEPKFSFLQVYLNVSRRGEDASAEATNLLARLNNTDEKVNASKLGGATRPHLNFRFRRPTSLHRFLAAHSRSSCKHWSPVAGPVQYDPATD